MKKKLHFTDVQALLIFNFLHHICGTQENKPNLLEAILVDLYYKKYELLRRFESINITLWRSEILALDISFKQIINEDKEFIKVRDQVLSKLSTALEKIEDR